MGDQSLGAPLGAGADEVVGPMVPTGPCDPVGFPADGWPEGSAGKDGLPEGAADGAAEASGPVEGAAADGTAELGASIGPNVQPAPVGVLEQACPRSAARRSRPATPPRRWIVCVMSEAFVRTERDDGTRGQVRITDVSQRSGC